MPKIEMDVSHNLPQDEALKRIKTLLGEVKNKHQDKIEDLHKNGQAMLGNSGFLLWGFLLPSH
jgi:hypothetical protein